MDSDLELFELQIGDDKPIEISKPSLEVSKPKLNVSEPHIPTSKSILNVSKSTSINSQDFKILENEYFNGRNSDYMQKYSDNGSESGSSISETKLDTDEFKSSLFDLSLDELEMPEIDGLSMKTSRLTIDTSTEKKDVINNQFERLAKQVRINNHISEVIYDNSPKSIDSNVSDVDRPSFDKINRINVTIRSLRNQLRVTTDISKLSQIAHKIAELEEQAVIEKSRGYKQLEKRKKTIEDKIDKMKRQLSRAESELQQVDNSLHHKVDGYRKLLQMRINMLHEEYSYLNVK